MCESDSLILVHAIFRHGDRTPVKEHMYPKDKHLNDDFYPYGFGQLTREGKKTMYELGEALRERYDKFLGEIYVPSKVDALTADTDRTKMSLQLVLAALYPPKADQALKDGLNWQPIPFNYTPYKDDTMFATLTRGDFIAAYQENYKKTSTKVHEQFFSYFEDHTGIKDPKPRNVWITLGTIVTEMEWGFEMAPWISPPIYSKIKEIALWEYQLQTATDELKRLAIGELLSKILKDTKSKIRNESILDIHLYSGHDHTVAHVLTVLGLMYPHFPRYSACVLLELHRIRNDYRLKVLYKDCKGSEFKPMRFPGGKDDLSLEEFEKILSFY